MGFIYLFFHLVMLSSEIPRLPTDPLVRGFPGVWNFSSFTTPSQDWSPSLTLLSLFLFFIFCPTFFRRQWAAFLGAWCPLQVFMSCFVEFSQCSNVLLMNLWGRKRYLCPISLSFIIYFMSRVCLDLIFVFSMNKITYSW